MWWCEYGEVFTTIKPGVFVQTNGKLFVQQDERLPNFRELLEKISDSAGRFSKL